MQGSSPPCVDGFGPPQDQKALQGRLGPRASIWFLLVFSYFDRLQGVTLLAERFAALAVVSGIVTRTLHVTMADSNGVGAAMGQSFES